MSEVSVIAGCSSEDLATKLSKEIGANLVTAKVQVFPDGESKLTLHGKLSKEKVIVVQSIYPPVDTNLLRALLLISKAREVSSKVIAVIPYMGYARQDREFLEGEIVTMKVLGELFRGAGASEVITVDIHSMVGLEAFKVRSRNVSAIPELAKHFEGLGLEEPLIVSLDEGGKDRAKEFADELNLEHIALEKERCRETGNVEIQANSSKVASISGRNLILVDDMISTGGSIIKAAQFLKQQECKDIYVACTHALLMNGAGKEIKKAGIVKIISANTIPHETAVVDVASTLARALGEVSAETKSEAVKVTLRNSL